MKCLAKNGGETLGRVSRLLNYVFFKGKIHSGERKNADSEEMEPDFQRFDELYVYALLQWDLDKTLLDN